MSRELETIIEDMRNAADKVADHGLSGMHGKRIIDSWANAIAALTASPQAAPEGDAVDVTGFGTPPLVHDERHDAEQAYTLTAFDYASAPIGSRDWTIYWRGWWHRAMAYASPQVQGGEARKPKDNALIGRPLSAIANRIEAALASGPSGGGVDAATVLRHERDVARASYDHAVKVLTGIHALLYPPAFKREDGVSFVFHSPHVHKQMQALSDRIRAIPDEIAAAPAAQDQGEGK
jgi:hypothetical protein